MKHITKVQILEIILLITIMSWGIVLVIGHRVQTEALNRLKVAYQIQQTTVVYQALQDDTNTRNNAPYPTKEEVEIFLNEVQQRYWQGGINTTFVELAKSFKEDQAELSVKLSQQLVNQSYDTLGRTNRAINTTLIVGLLATVMIVFIGTFLIERSNHFNENELIDDPEEQPFSAIRSEPSRPHRSSFWHALRRGIAVIKKIVLEPPRDK